MRGGSQRTHGNLRRGRSIVFFVEMPYFLPQQTLQKCLPQGACGPGSRNAYAKCSHIADDEAGKEQIHEVEDEMVDPGSELLGVALARREAVQGGC